MTGSEGILKAIVGSRRGHISVRALTHRLGYRGAKSLRRLILDDLVEVWELPNSWRLTLTPIGAARLGVRIEAKTGLAWRWVPIAESSSIPISSGRTGRRRDVAAWPIDSRTGELLKRA